MTHLTPRTETPACERQRRKGKARESESAPHAPHIRHVARVPLPDVLVEAGGVVEHAPSRKREREGERGEGFVRGEARDPSNSAH